MEAAKATAADVARMEEQKVHLQTLNRPAQVLTGIVTSKEYLKEVQPDLAICLTERIGEWIELRWPNALIGLTYDPSTLELRTEPIPMYYVKITALMSAAAKAIKEQSVKEEAQGTKQDT
jgi:hypothetical protein